MEIIGHRGARGTVPENTIASFKEAIAYGVDAVEFDLRVTADRKVVVYHDAAVRTKQNEIYPVAVTPLAKLKTLKPNLLTLDELLKNLNSSTKLMIEIKPGVPTAPIFTTLQHEIATGRPVDFMQIVSFDQSILREANKTFPTMQLGVIETWSSWRARRRAHELGTKQIALLEYWVWPGFIRAMHRAGYELYVYPSTNGAKKRRFRSLGLRGVTDYPERARKWSRAGLTGIITDHPEYFSKHRHLN